MASLALFPASPLDSAPPAGLLASLSRRFGKGAEILVARAKSSAPDSAGESSVAAEPNSAGESNVASEPSSGGLLGTLQLGALFGPWYLFNIYNMQVLKVFPFPMTITTCQFATGAVLMLFMWLINLYKRPKISASQLVAILPLAMVHTSGNLFANRGLGKVVVSFTHTIKPKEPFFSVLHSSLFVGELPTVWVLLSLVPIVGGVALAFMTEASFNWAGFWSAMASNLTFQSRNVLRKKLMVKKEESLDNINLFSITTIMSFCLLAPVTLFVEGVKFTPSYVQSAVSYMIPARVSPVTHSVGNCVKGVVVIVTSVLFFRTPVLFINSLGTGVALTGVFLHLRVKKIKPKTA